MSLTYGFACFSNSLWLLEIVSSKVTPDGNGAEDDEYESESEQEEPKVNESQRVA